MTNGTLWSAHNCSFMLFLFHHTFPFVQIGLFTICREIPSLVPGTHSPFSLPCFLQAASHSFLFSPLLLVQHFLPFFKYTSQRCHHLGSWGQFCSTVGPLEPAVSNMRQLQLHLRGVCSHFCQHLGSYTQHTSKCKIAL